jgi:hypothetical protein
MSIGTVSLNTSHKKEPTGSPGPPFLPTSAYNGLSVDSTGKIVLGNDYGDPLQPATLLDVREIDMNQTDIFFDLFGNSTTAGGFEALALGINPFSGIAGISFNIDYSLYDPALYQLIGIALTTADIGSQSGWFRGFGNDNFVFGTMFSSGDTLPAARFVMFDSGNVTLNSQVNTYPQSQDIDTGITYFVFGSMGMQLLPAAGANPITSVGWDTVTGELLQNLDPIFDSVGIFSAGSDAQDEGFLDVQAFAGGIDTALTLTNANLLSGMFAKIQFTKTLGSIVFSNGNSPAIVSDSGNLIQIYGNVDVNGNLNVSTGATGSFTTVDLKTVTVTAGIITAIV